MGSRQTKQVVLFPGAYIKRPRGAENPASRVGVITTGVNKGKTYPYASTKRGGPPADSAQSLSIRRDRIIVVDPG